MAKASRSVVVFDLGGVLIDWDPRHLYRKLFAGDEAAMEDFLLNVCTHDWNRRQDAGRSFAEGGRVLKDLHPDKAALIDAYQRIRSLNFEVNVDLVESLGADKYVYFTVEGPVVHSDQLSELDDETGAAEHEFVARVPAASKAVKGKKFGLAFDTSQLAVFDPDSGANLTIAPAPEVQ